MNFARPSRLYWTLRTFGFLGLVVLGFALPGMPSTGLDASWQMALGRFFTEGRQFGTEIVFTYGPLGWTMGNMYWGQQWGGLIGWHLLLAIVMALLVCWHAGRLPVHRRVLFLLFYFLLGLRYEDILQQAALAMAGLELIRRSDARWQWSSVALVGLLALLSLVKFTNLLLAVAFVFLAAALPAWKRRWPQAWPVPVWFAGLLLLGWIACGQNPLNLPAYFRHSWEISSGYQDAMGWSCSTVELYHGLGVAALLTAYLVVNAWTGEDRKRSLILALAAATYLFLNWKHGFVRADGHQLVFYFAALALIAGTPLLLGDGSHRRWLKSALLLAAALLALRGAELTVPGLARGAFATMEERARRNLQLVLHPAVVHAEYDNVLADARQGVAMPLTQLVTKHGTVDVLGFEQSVAILNELNYVPRPVFQSYSAYTPRLARLNLDYYTAERAPEFVLFKLHPIDERLASMDDAPLLPLLVERYTYLFSERGFTVWQRKPGAPRPATAPTVVRELTARLGQSVDVTDLATRNVWVNIDYELNTLGRLRRLLFKPPLLHLKVTDQAGTVSVFRLPQRMGQAGFLLNPLLQDLADYMRAAAGDPRRRAASFAIEVAPNDRDCVAEEVALTLSTLPAHSASGIATLALGTAEAPLTFVRGSAQYGSDLSFVEGHLEHFAHAPSQLVYRPAAGATVLRGGFGLRPPAYAPANQHPTDGAEFIVRWRAADGTAQVLFHRLLRPREQAADRGLQLFRVDLPRPAGGELEFVTDPGPDGNAASDWTYWSDLQLENSP